MSTLPTAVAPLIDAIVAAMQDAVPDDAEVFDSYQDTSMPGSYLLIGVDDPDSDEFADSANSTQTWADIGRSRKESGSITCCAIAWNNDADPKAARDDCLAVVSELARLGTQRDFSLGLIDQGISVQSLRVFGTAALRQRSINQARIALYQFRIQFDVVIEETP